MNSNTAPSRRIPKFIDKKQASSLRDRAKKFDQIFESEQKKFQKSKNHQYYIISTVYLEQWREYCLSSQNQRLLPIPMNQDLVIPGTQDLRTGLSQQSNFQIVSPIIYNLVKLQDNKEITICREAYYQNQQKKVTIYLSSIRYMSLVYQDLKNIDYRRKLAGDLEINKIQVSSTATIEQFISKIKQKQKLQSCKTRIWKCPKTLTIQQIFKHLKQKCAPQHSRYVVPGLGKLIENDQASQASQSATVASNAHNTVKLSDLNLEEGQFFISQSINQSANWFFRNPDEQRCENCYKYKKLTIHCGCKKVGYCCEACQQKDKIYHLKRCQYAEEMELNKKVQMVMTDRSARGLVGLSNLGNTCFMNSCLQCLSHTSLLTEYFLKSYYEKQINKENVLGTKGKLAKTYANFIKNMWCNSQKSYSPYSLKSVVASINPMFSGYAQHDSQQFFSFLIDGLNEDLSRVLKKPYVESVESKGRKDQEVSKQSWIGYTKRNQSIITDLMTGQYKSKVVCPDCSKESITFDPFITISLPIPEETTPGYLRYFVIFNNNESKPKRMSFTYKKADPKVWVEEAAKLLKKQPNRYVFYILTVYEDVYSLADCPKSQILHKLQVQNKIPFLLELSSQQRNLKQPVELVTRFSKRNYYGDDYDNLWFKRPFFFEKQEMKGINVYVRMLKYLYSSYSKKKSTFFGGISEGDYIKNMTGSKDRPFILVLKYEKIIDRHYHRVETKFEKEIAIEDQCFIPSILSKMKKNDYQLDVRFKRETAKQFDFEKMKDYDDHSQKQKKSREEAKVSIEQCFRVFEQKQVLEAGNQWYCSDCKQHKLASKQMLIYKAPEILILHLKRFKNKGILRKEKNQANVLFPQNLNISQYVINPEPMINYNKILKKQEHYIEPTYKIEEKKSGEPQYELYAVSNHYGGLGGGHYTAYAKNNNKWYQFDDSYVKAVSEEALKGSGAYMLFYRRINSVKIL